MNTATERHACNLYCADGEHCDLIYTNAPDSPHTREQIVSAYYYKFARVTRIESPTEAPPLEAIPRASRQAVGLAVAVNEERSCFLVYWREDA